MLNVDFLKVVVGPGGEGGNPLGVVVDGSAVPDPAVRQAIAAHPDYSEAVFVDGSLQPQARGGHHSTVCRLKLTS